MKEPSVLIGKSNLNKREIQEVVMQTSDKDSTREATERLLKILEITYAKADFYEVADNANQLKVEERTLRLRIFKDFEDLFDGTLGDWYTETIDLRLKPDSKPFNSKYDLVPMINKEKFRKDLKLLVVI